MWWWSLGATWARTVCAYYGFALIATAIALIFSCYYTARARTQISKRSKSRVTSEEKSAEMEDCKPQNVGDDESESDLDTLQSRMKFARHQAIINHLSSSLTEEQLMEEKEVEKAQLAAILNLLKEQKDKFQVSDMDELEQQLSLYR